jgi:hypothetical protein
MPNGHTVSASWRGVIPASIETPCARWRGGTVLDGWEVLATAAEAASKISNTVLSGGNKNTGRSGAPGPSASI